MHEYRSTVEQVHDQVLDLIAANRLAPGDKLPTEAELCQRFRAGRSTVREALKRLEEAGTVCSVQGRGRFLSASGGQVVQHPITHYQSPAAMLEARGYEVSTQIMEVAVVQATAKVAQGLGIEYGDDVIRVIRLFLGDGKPMVVSRTAIRRDVLPGPVKHRDWSQSLVTLLASHGHRLVSATTILRAVEIPVELESRFSLGGLGPWLLVEEVAYSHTGLPVIAAMDYHRGAYAAFGVRRLP
jgi:DNA-binding GntR family transcriptional regulator